MKQSTLNVHEQLQRVVNKILFLKKKSMFQFQDETFYPSEVHLMLTMGGADATNATRMAQLLGVTKGAVSQTISRLEKKGVLTKWRDPYNKNELTIELTDFGRLVFDHYRERVNSFRELHARYIDSFSEAEKETIQRFLAEVERFFDHIE